MEETKTHVVWTHQTFSDRVSLLVTPPSCQTSSNVDMSQLTTMFPQTTSKSDRQEQDERLVLIRLLAGHSSTLPPCSQQ